ncbi:hypothetical protein [Halobacterium rubrum]|uniref:hypothetical protein n=1 Tax=Halobacterium TaxID=2239 RepID=UPI001F159071|nr:MULTISPECIES: hypothetical protein [Halobacterium]MDH5021718.1 hypothetical protein [Halobacterium rubrum]
MLPITHARRLANQGETASTWAGQGVAVITTTTIADDKLARLGHESELEIVERFRPDYHVPTDYAVYGDDPLSKQREQATACAQGTRWMADRVPDETTVVPLIKGSTPNIRAITERAAADLGVDIVAFYGGQYETTPWTRRKATLNQDLRGIQRETAGLPVVVIGATGPWTLLDMPGNVQGVAGLRRWREAVTPRSTSASEMQTTYRSVVEGVKSYLGASSDGGGISRGGGVSANGGP